MPMGRCSGWMRLGGHPVSQRPNQALTLQLLRCILSAPSSSGVLTPSHLCLFVPSLKDAFVYPWVLCFAKLQMWSRGDGDFWGILEPPLPLPLQGVPVSTSLSLPLLPPCVCVCVCSHLLSHLTPPIKIPPSLHLGSAVRAVSTPAIWHQAPCFPRLSRSSGQIGV